MKQGLIFGWACLFAGLAGCGETPAETGPDMLVIDPGLDMEVVDGGATDVGRSSNCDHRGFALANGSNFE